MIELSIPVEQSETDTANTVVLSVVSTLYHSGKTVAEFVERTMVAAGSITSKFEIILVDDGSPDNSLEAAQKLADVHDNLVVVELSRNHGHHRALMAGLALAKGEWVFKIDSDLEEAPEWLATFWGEAHREEVDVVYGVQDQRKGGVIERFAGFLFWKLFNSLSDTPVTPNLVTARLLRRNYVNALLEFSEREVFLGGVWELVGFRQRALTVDKLALGQSTYSFRKRFELLINALTSFSAWPLRMMFRIGCVVTLIPLVVAVWILSNHTSISQVAIGWASLILSIWFLGGLTILFLGLIGLYLAKIYIEIKQRPYAIVRTVKSGQNNSRFRQAR